MCRPTVEATDRLGSVIPVVESVVQSSFAAPVAWLTASDALLTDNVSPETPTSEAARPLASTPSHDCAPCVIETSVSELTEPEKPVAPVVSIEPPDSVAPDPTNTEPPATVSANADA